ncbi:hypothetical protein AMTR_s00044p00119700 [Amborella trichopoda]|uniref:Uncharacterized protein n=1 Tax=Amborella trichopoda TaxID=13333 RepID=U5D6U5_AMBTC|nr:hypothetical protein AMTR_s00044p00119700 [Amborella trichopoda]
MAAVANSAMLLHSSSNRGLSLKPLDHGVVNITPRNLSFSSTQQRKEKSLSCDSPFTVRCGYRCKLGLLDTST